MMSPEQLARWQDPKPKPFRLFQSVAEELAVKPDFWRSRTPLERMEYLEFSRCVVFGEEIVNAPMVRCYGWRNSINDEHDPKNLVYF